MVLLNSLQEWIELVNDFDYLPEPTVQILAGVVAHVMGGNNQKLAKKIAGKYRYHIALNFHRA